VRANVHLTLRERGKIVGRTEGHNVVVDAGRTWLSQYIAEDSLGDPIDERSILYMGLGIGGYEQTMQGLIAAPPINPAYVPGFDPNATTGFEYRDDCPVKPPITTLEMPVRLTGSSNPYWGALPADEWLASMTPASPYNGIITHPTAYSTSYRAFFDGTAGHIIYAPFTTMPLSEAGLYLNSPTLPITNKPYFNKVVAYIGFPPIIMTAVHELEVSWHVRF